MPATPRELEQQRCGVCGLIHPFLAVCPLIEEQEVRVDANRTAGTRSRIVRTRYFPRPEIFKAIQEAGTDVEAATPVKTRESLVKKERIRRRKA